MGIMTLNGKTFGTVLDGGNPTATRTVTFPDKDCVVAPTNSPVFTGTVSGVTKSMVGLSDVDNTSDLFKPISIAIQKAIDLKVDITSEVHLVKSDVGLGNVDNTTDLLKPISTATQTALDTKADLDSPTFTGIPTAPTAPAGTNTWRLATTAFVTTADNLKAPLDSPVFTGNVTGLGVATGTSLSLSVATGTAPLAVTSTTRVANLNVATAGNADTVTTNANLTGHITSTGNATILGSFTSLNLLTALTDETGTGVNVFATSPTLVTPLLGTPTSGVLTNCTGLPTAGIVDLAVTTAKIAAAAVTQAKVKIKSVVALADAAATLTAAQMIDSTIFTITPTAARTLTTDTAANLVLGLPGYQIGTWFDIVIINTAAFDVTLAAGTGVTLVGKAIINNVSGSWKCRFDSATAVTIYRM